MEEQGLAQQTGAEQQGGQMNQQQMMALVQEIVKLLKQGVSPKDIVAQGVPEQIVDMAVQAAGMQDQDMDTDKPMVPGGMSGKGLAQTAVQQ